MSIDLNKLANKLDEALSNETSETLTKFFNDKRMTNNKHTQVVDFSNPNADKITSGSTKTMTNNKQQTAVEWLEKQTRKPEWHSLKRGDIFEQAKEIEKERMIEFAKEFIDVVNVDDKDIEEHFNETYGDDKQ